MTISLNEKITITSLLKFALPSIIMMVFMSFYTIIDGIFISRFVSSDALSSLNIVYPFISIIIALSTMLATGGNAIISRQLGKGNIDDANAYLTMFTIVGVSLSIILAVVSNIFITPICYFLGATELLIADCRIYLQIIMIFAPACVLQTLFQSYLVTAGKSSLGLYLIASAGIFNGILDYLFIVTLNMGIAGAALATGIGQLIPALAGLLYFRFSNNALHFTSFRFNFKILLESCYNGSSEMVEQLAGAIITFLFNLIMLRQAGEHGVAAITILLYGQFLFNAFYMGFSIGISPLLGFHYGAKNKAALRKLYNLSMIFVSISSFILMIVSLLTASDIVSFFTNDTRTYELAATGFQLFAFNFLFSGINIISSGIFTALSNGKISAFISFSRTFIFLISSLLLLPQLLGLTGVWLAVPVAEFLTLLLCIFIHFKYFRMTGKQNYIL